MTVAHGMTPSPSAGPQEELLDAVLAGLSRPQKALPSRFFYDARGSALFERITELPEYYPTRVETGILQTHAKALTQSLSSGGILVEFGSGSSTKTELLLRELPHNAGYAPIDVSHAALEDAHRRLERRFPDLTIWPIVGDFSQLTRLPRALGTGPRLGFFPGSTIGNFTPAEASRLLNRLRTLLAPEGRLVIGVDLKKDSAILERAYNDAAGVTAEFNLNILARINRDIAPVFDRDGAFDLEGVFDLEGFDHKAFYNSREGRIEMHLVSRRKQIVSLAGRQFTLSRGETIHTENSYKYGVSQFQDLARSAGWNPSQVWTDPEQLFSIHELA